MRLAPYFLLLLLIAVPGSTALSQSDFWVPTGGPPNSNVRCVAVDSAGKIYAGTAGGYLWISTDNGTTWIQAKNGMKDSVVNALVVGPGGIVYAGTSGNDGMYRSADSGAHWSKIIADSTSDRAQVSAICIDAGGQLLVVSGGGISVSTDNGGHWQTTSIGRRGMTSIASSSGWLLFAGTGNGFYRSTDHGESWENKSNGLQDSSVLSVAVDENDYVLAGTDGGGLYGSLDYGENWTRIDKGFINSYIRTIAVNSIGVVFAGTEGGGVYRSADEGDSWTPVNSGITNLNIESFAFSPAGIIFVGTSGGGVCRSAQPTTPVRMPREELPKEAHLKQNYPNPFNPSTVIRYRLPDRRPVSLKVYNILGGEIATLVNGIQGPGEKSVVWNAAGLPSGIYFYKLVAGSRTEVRKMTLLR